MSKLRADSLNGLMYLHIGCYALRFSAINKIEMTAKDIIFHGFHGAVHSIENTPETFKQLESIVKEYGHLMMKKIDQ